MATNNTTTDLNSIFMDLPIEKNYNEILNKVRRNKQFRRGPKGHVVRNLLENSQYIKLSFDKYSLFETLKCTNCYIQSNSNNQQKKIELVLNFETLNQTEYSNLLATLWQQLESQTKAIKKNKGADASITTCFFLSEKSEMPVVVIKEQSNKFDFISVEFIDDYEK